MRLARVSFAATIFTLPLLACASDVWLGDLQATASTTVPSPYAPDAGAPTPDGPAITPDKDVDVPDVVADVIADVTPDLVPDATPDVFVDAGTDADACSAIDCKGQGCADGVCVTLPLATGQTGILYLAMDATDIFWGTVGHSGAVGDRNVLAKTARAGGPIVTLNSDGGQVRGITVDDSQVYWLRQNSGGGASLSRASKVDGSGQTITGAFPTATNVQGLVHDSTNLYAVNGSELRVFNLTDSAAPGSPFISSLTAGTAAVSFLDEIFIADTGAGAIDLVTKSTQTMKPFAGLPGAPVDVALDFNYVYFAATTLVGRVSRATGAVETLASGFAGVAGVAVDTDNVYFTTTNSVVRVSLTTKVATVIASSLTKGGRLVVDDTFVYFADSGGGVIGRVPK